MRAAKGHRQMTGPVDEPVASYRYFRNPSCEFFPCHAIEDDEGFNCLFCYCPLYSGECPGEPSFVSINGRMVKDCTGCLFPHSAENYDDMIRCLMERIS